jgi:hypothetical protein
MPKTARQGLYSQPFIFFVSYEVALYGSDTLHKAREACQGQTQAPVTQAAAWWQKLVADLPFFNVSGLDYKTLRVCKVQKWIDWVVILVFFDVVSYQL